MRGVVRADWDGLYIRVRGGDAEALVTLRNQAIRLVARCRVARYSSIPPWLREELAEEAFDRTEPAFPRLETWERAFAYMATTMNRLIFRTSAREHRVALEDLAERLIDPEPPRRMLQTDIVDFILETAGTLSQARYRQFRALVQACWAECDGRETLSEEAGISARTWSSERKDLIECLRKLLGNRR